MNFNSFRIAKFVCEFKPILATDRKIDGMIARKRKKKKIHILIFINRCEQFYGSFDIY